MRLLCNNTEKEIADHITLIDELLNIQRDAMEQQLILEIRVNGEPYYDEIPGLRFVQGIEVVEATLKRPIEMLVEGMIEATQYLPRLISGLDMIIGQFHASEDYEATSNFLQVLEGLHWFHTVLEGVSTFIDPELVEQVLSESLSVRIDQYNKILHEMLQAWENGDYVLIADLCEFELIPQLEKWTEHMVGLLDLMSKQKYN